jgi:putative endonuclease
MVQKQDNQNKIRLGRWGENCACKYLEAQGMSLIARNVRSPYGEIDIIMKHESMTIFVEVKTRSSAGNGYPEDAITPGKMQHLDDCAHWYNDEHPEIGDNWRVDVITVIGRPGNSVKPKIDWWQNEF